MGVPRPARPTPASQVTDWPNRHATDPSVETARLLALNLATAMDGRSLRTIRDLTGVDHSTIGDILNGSVWPDLQTIARLEHGLGVPLYPRLGDEP